MKRSTSDIVHQAYGKFGVAAFNVFTAEQVHGVFRGAEVSGMPVIVQITPVARNYMHPKFMEGMIAAADKIYPSAHYSVHVDHGNAEHCIDAITSGFYNSIMIDASHEPYENNIAITSDIVKRAHANGMAVEAELGVLQGIEDTLNIAADKSRYTDPDQVVEFVERTGCDFLAVAVGTSHGAYKMSGGTGLQLDIVREIQKRLPGFPLVLHGASNVPPSEVERINKAGGQLKTSAKGIDEKELLQAIVFGVTKINIATDMRLMWTRIHREYFKNVPDAFDPIVPGNEYIEALKTLVIQKCQSLRLPQAEKI